MLSVFDLCINDFKRVSTAKKEKGGIVICTKNFTLVDLESELQNLTYKNHGDLFQNQSEFTWWNTNDKSCFKVNIYSHSMGLFCKSITILHIYVLILGWFLHSICFVLFVKIGICLLLICCDCCCCCYGCLLWLILFFILWKLRLSHKLHNA